MVINLGNEIKNNYGSYMNKFKFNNSLIAKNSAFLFILTFSNYFIGFILYPYLARVLSVDGFGLLGFSMAYVLVFQVFIEYGFMISATASVSKNRSDFEKVSEIVSTVMHSRLILTTVSTIVFLLIPLFFPFLRANFVVIFLFYINAILTALLPDFYFRGTENMKVMTIRTVLSKLVGIALVILLVRNQSKFVFVPIALIGGNSLALLASILQLRGVGIKIKFTSHRHAIRNIRESSMFFYSRVAAGINQSIGLFILGFRYSPTSIEVGNFTGALRISTASEMMLAPFSDSLYPYMVNNKNYRLFKKVIIFGGIAWLLVCSVAFIYADTICTIMLGAKYNLAGSYLRILLFGNFMAFFSNMFGYTALVPIGKSSHANFALLIGTIANLLAFLALWYFNQINAYTVCAVISITNLIIFIYRGFIFWTNRHLVKQLNNVT